jgi:hypothetical protein
MIDPQVSLATIVLRASLPAHPYKEAITSYYQQQHELRSLSVCGFIYL